MFASTTISALKPEFSLPLHINPRAAGAAGNLLHVLVPLLNDLEKSYTQLLILCIGSDRSTGDSLGPLVGNNLQQLLQQNRFVTILGTLSQPVHAQNLKETIDYLGCNYRSAAVLAVDACLGQKNKIGCLEIGRGNIFPGAALNKELPPVGDLYIVGIVNCGGFMDALILQSTRLGVVYPLAQFISAGIYRAISLTGWLVDRP